MLCEHGALISALTKIYSSPSSLSYLENNNIFAYINYSSCLFRFADEARILHDTQSTKVHNYALTDTWFDVTVFSVQTGVIRVAPRRRRTKRIPAVVRRLFYCPI